MEQQTCGVHGTPMSLRNGTYGQFWSCGKKDANGSWCKFKPGKPIDAMRERQVAATPMQQNGNVTNQFGEMLTQLKKINENLAMLYALFKLRGTPSAPQSHPDDATNPLFDEPPVPNF